MTSTKLKTLAIGICAFAIVGVIFGASEEVPSWGGTLGGVFLGAVVGLLIMVLEVFVFPSNGLRPIDKLPLTIHFLIRLLSWIAVIFFVIDLFGPPRTDPEWATSMAICLILTFVAVSFIMVERIIGQTALGNLLTGKYYRPKEAEFALLLIDLKGSTEIADRIGNQKYFSFLDRFVTEACDPIRANGGEIYKFVGDEIIAYWPADKNADLNGCSLAWNAMVLLFDKLGPSYEAEFGAKPTLRAAMHVGQLVIGQIGQYRQEIAMLGEPMNAASRILALGGERNIELVISETANARIGNPSAFETHSLGKILLRGCADELELFSAQFPQTEQNSLPAQE